MVFNKNFDILNIHPLKTYDEMHFLLTQITNIFTLAINFKINILSPSNTFTLATNFEINIFDILN